MQRIAHYIRIIPYMVILNMKGILKPHRILGAAAFLGIVGIAANNVMNSYASAESDRYWQDFDRRMTELRNRSRESRREIVNADLTVEFNLPPPPTLESRIEYNESSPWDVTEGQTADYDRMRDLVERFMDANPGEFRSDYRRQRALTVLTLVNEIAPQYGLDATFVSGLGYYETHLGIANEAAREANNIFNVDATPRWRQRGGDVYITNNGRSSRSYDSLRESVEDVCRVLQRGYVNRGYTQVPDVLNRYAPPTENDTRTMIATLNRWREELQESNSMRLAYIPRR